MGVVLLEHHFPETTEVHFMAVARERHRQGIGTRLLDAVEAQQRGRGARLLEVKTLGPSRPDAEYDRTRAFYRARGFLPVEETDLVGVTTTPACDGQAALAASKGSPARSRCTTARATRRRCPGHSSGPPRRVAR